MNKFYISISPNFHTGNERKMKVSGLYSIFLKFSLKNLVVRGKQKGAQKLKAIFKYTISTNSSELNPNNGQENQTYPN